MSSYAMVKDAGAFLAGAAGIKPQNSAAATVNGAAVDRLRYQSCVVVCMTGAATGSPTTQTLTFKVQDSADGTTGWADLEDVGGTVYSKVVSADDTVTDLDVKLGGARQYIRVVCTVAFTGGTTPRNDVAAALVLAGVSEAELPA